MNPPPLLMGSALVFWGTQTGYLVWGVLMGIVLEGSRLVRMRWDLAPNDFYRLSDLTALALMGMGIYRFTAGTASMARWLPFALFPILAAQAYSSVGGVDMGALFYTFRQREKKGLIQGRQTIDIAFPGLALIALSASAANIRTPAFFVALAVLAGWALWSRRPGYAPISFFVLLLSAALAGYGGQTSLHNLQVWLEGQGMERFMGLRQGHRNPSRAWTAMGEIGRLKQSDRIVMRVRPLGSTKAPLLLHEASYNRFAGRTWVAAHARFNPIDGPMPGNPPCWELAEIPSGKKQERVEIIAAFENGRGVLSLPHGTYRIMGLAADSLARSPYGAVRASGMPSLIRYETEFQPGIGGQAPPGEYDLDVPPEIRAPFRALAIRLNLADLPPERIVETIRAHFKKRFTYSLVQSDAVDRKSPLIYFLITSRSGHCEYFATATVLLLRTSGIAARYATGYVAAETSRLEDCLVVRSRHGHAWAMAWIDGRWHPVDSTPSRWLETEEEQVSFLAPVWDLFRFIAFQFTRWRQAVVAGKLPVPAWSGWVLAAMLLFFIWHRLRLRQTVSDNNGKKGKRKEEAPLVPASPFYEIEALLARAGMVRYPWEPPGEWAMRLEKDLLDPDTAAIMNRLVRRHYRLRFHPASISSTDLEIMKQDSLALRAQLENKTTLSIT